MTGTGPALPGLTCLADLGSGGYADVHLYERAQPRLRVAVKLLKLDKVTDAERRQFTAEADAMAELAEHPYIVSVLGADTAPDGRPYLVMNYYPGPDLLQQVSTKPLSVADALRTGIKLAGAIETAHRAGIIHRDIKPANVLMSSYGEPGLSDFGIAGRNGAPEDDDQIGISIPWAPPEVITGQSNGSVSSDVYSLAATIWHLLVGRSPFSVPGDNSMRAITGRILHTPAPATGRADAPSSLDRLLQQGLAKQPALRPHSAIQFARLLQGVEQELRLARTPIVVPEGGDISALDPPATDTSTVLEPPESASGDDEATILKRPTTISPSRPVPLAAPWEAPTDQRPAKVAPGASAGSSTAAAADVTDRRPAQVRAATSGAQDELTERRPRRAETPATPAAATDGSTAAVHRWIAAAVVAGLLVIAAIVGVVLANSGHDKPTAAPPAPPGPSDAGDIIGGSPVVPDITGSSHGSKVVFKATPPEAGETYSWVLAPVGGTLAPIAGSAGKTRISVPADPSGTTCVKLKVTSNGQVSLGDKCVP